MSIKNIKESDIIKALEYIDKNGVPDKNKSTQYDLITEGGKKYPPKYVVAIADFIANGSDNMSDNYNSIMANKLLRDIGFKVESRQEKFQLVITKDSVTSNDESFDINNLSAGDNYKPLEAYFERENGDIVKRNYSKGEKKISNQTLPRIACQIFEKQLSALSVEEKEEFPVCQYNPSSPVIKGIYPSVERYRQYHNSIEYLGYNYGDSRKFVLYCWNIFSTILFVKECLKRFGRPGDKFVLVYREKEEKYIGPQINISKSGDYKNEYSKKLIESKNIIFRGAPGTGKSYLAKEIAADIITNGYKDDYNELDEEQKQQVEFVQFHPAYDYSDFVEGLRPKTNTDGSMGFELQDGIFKKFVKRAQKNLENSKKSKGIIEKENSVQQALAEFLSDITPGEDSFKTVRGSEFFITDIDDEHIYISIPQNTISDHLILDIEHLEKMLQADTKFEKIRDITAFWGKNFATQAESYYFALYNEILSIMKKPLKAAVREEEKNIYLLLMK